MGGKSSLLFLLKIAFPQFPQFETPSVSTRLSKFKFKSEFKTKLDKPFLSSYYAGSPLHT